jgi:hypothetical protein
MFSAKTKTLIDTGGVSRTVGYSAAPVNMRQFLNGAGNTGDAYGIIPGSDDTPDTYEDTNLGAVLSHSVDAGLFYYANGISLRQGDNSYYEEKHTRLFVNASSSPITVKEFGLVVRIYDSSGVIRQFLAYHEILDPPVTVIPAVDRFNPVPGSTVTLGLLLRVDA